MPKLHAVVVGGSSGIGAAVVSKFLKQNYRVTAVSRNTSNLANMIEELPEEKKSDVQSLALDVSLHGESALLSEACGPLVDSLVVTVGNGSPSSKRTLNEKFLDSISHNVSPLLNSWEALKNEVNRSNVASVVFVSSIASIEHIGAPVEYAMSKATLAPLVGSLARENAPVRFNLVSPGNVLTENSVWKKRTGEDEVELSRQIKESVPLSRLADPIEIASVVYFLASAESSFVTGANFVADGGQTKAFNV